MSEWALFFWGFLGLGLVVPGCLLLVLGVKERAVAPQAVGSALVTAGAAVILKGCLV